MKYEPNYRIRQLSNYVFPHAECEESLGIRWNAGVLLDFTNVMDTILCTEAGVGFAVKLDERLLLSYHPFEATNIALKQRKPKRVPELQR